MQPVLDIPASTYPIPSSQWLQDDETGFLYMPVRNDGLPTVTAFSLDKKKQFVDTYRSLFPDLEETLKQIGVSRRTFYYHIHIDPKFREVIEDLRAGRADKVESRMFHDALTPKQFMAQIAILRAYRPELYTERKINLTAKDLDPNSAMLKMQSLGTVVDAELVPGPGPVPSQSVINSQEDRKAIPAPGLDDKKTGNQFPGPPSV